MLVLTGRDARTDVAAGVPTARPKQAVDGEAAAVGPALRRDRHARPRVKRSARGSRETRTAEPHLRTLVMKSTGTRRTRLHAT